MSAPAQGEEAAGLLEEGAPADSEPWESGAVRYSTAQYLALPPAIRKASVFYRPRN